MNENELNKIIEGCRERHQASQYKLYSHFYNYAMSVARRYVFALEECEEVVNDAFFKVFNKIELFTESFSFKAWLRRIVVNTAIDRIRAQQRLPKTQEIVHDAHDTDIESDLIVRMTKEQILRLVHQLPTAYRTVFTLYVVDEFSHEEIAEALNISIGASKSNLSRARQNLKRILEQEEKIRNT